jgi:hypothetical protein
MRLHRTLRLAWLSAALLLASCSDRGPNQPGGLTGFVAPVPGQVGSGDELALNERLWKSSGIYSYSYRFRWECFCEISYVSTVDVTVRRGVIVSVIDVDTGRLLDPGSFARYRTIDELFDLVRKARDEGAATINVTYDRNLGYPYQVFVDYLPMVIDEELGFRVYGLVAHRSR